MKADEVIIGPINLADQGHSIEVEYQVGSNKHKVYFRTADCALTANTEAFVAFAFPYGLVNGGVIRANGDISQRFMSSIPTILDIYCTWFPVFKRFDIEGVNPVAVLL